MQIKNTVSAGQLPQTGIVTMKISSYSPLLLMVNVVARSYHYIALSPCVKDKVNNILQ